MALINFGGVKEEVVTRKEFPMTRARKVLKDETIAVLGYGVQGPAQALNMKDNGFKVIIGQSKQFPKDWDRARKDGWVPGKDLFEIEEASERGTVLEVLVSDAAQTFLISGHGDVIEPDEAVAAVGSGGPYALAAAEALIQHTSLPARKVAEEAMRIAGKMCIFTNDKVTIEDL